MNTAQLLRQMRRDANDDFWAEVPLGDLWKRGGILTLRYILDNMGFDSHDDMLKIQEFLRDLEMEK